jgi:S1-C subfamily serine protease
MSGGRSRANELGVAKETVMTKNKCTAFAILVSFSFAIAVSYGSAQSKSSKLEPIRSLSDRIDHIRNSVVRVSLRFEDGAIIHGSGFVINKSGFVITANHVVNPPGRTLAETKKARLTVEAPIPPTAMGSKITIAASFLAADATITATDAAHDIAVLTSPEIMKLKIGVVQGKAIDLPVLPVRLSAVSIKDGEAVFVSGYPLEIPVLITNSGFVASSVPFEVDPTNNDLLDTYWLDMQANPGNSGGPVLSLRTGNVIAVQVGVELTAVKYMDGTKEDVTLQVAGPDGKVTGTRAIGYNAGIAEVVSAKYVQDLLIKNGVMF